jgi:hypothetical protein
VNTYAIWFQRAVVLGILVNCFFALPGIFIPNAVLAWVGAEPATEPVWPAFASLLLVLVSLFYIPAAVDPFRYCPVAVLAVLARGAGVVFFLVLYPGRAPALFGYIDLGFALVQGILLLLALRVGPAPEPS